MTAPKLSKSWYKHWYSAPIAVITLPLFALWYVWVELERSRLFRIGITAALLAIYVGGGWSLVSALSGTPATQDASTTSNNNTLSATQADASTGSPAATATTPTQAAATTQQTTTQSTAKASTSTSTASTTTSGTQSGNTTTTTQPETLIQQYPDTYPSTWANAAMDTLVDTWGMSNRESVSYTAYKVNEAYGDMPTNWDSLGANSGNAKNWPTDAQYANISTGTTAKLHSVAIRTTGATGFSAWVEAVNGDQVTVSSYNSDGSSGSYNVQTVPAASFSTYIYFQ